MKKVTVSNNGELYSLDPAKVLLCPYTSFKLACTNKCAWFNNETTHSPNLKNRMWNVRCKETIIAQMEEPLL